MPVEPEERALVQRFQDHWQHSRTIPLQQPDMVLAGEASLRLGVEPRRDLNRDDAVDMAGEGLDHLAGIGAGFNKGP